MLLNIFALVVVLGVTFVHSMFGLFSGVINVFCTITAAAVAFGFTEPLNRLLTGSFHLHAGYSESVAFVLLFVITLLILRLLADGFIRGNVRIPMYLDWGGGALCGFVIAQICVGVAIIGLLLLPWGGRLMMYSRMERDENNHIDSATGRVVFQENHMWLRSDEFAVGLVNLLSNGSLRGSTTFASVYPDYTEWVFWTGNQQQREVLASALRDDRSDGFDEGGLGVEQWWDQSTPLGEDYTRYRKLLPDRSNSNPPYVRETFRPQAGNRVIGMRLNLKAAAADRTKDWTFHRFRPSNIRIVGDIVQPDGSRTPAQYVPQVIGGADSRIDDNLRIVDLDANFSFRSGEDDRIDVYFEVDDRFEPRFVEYRRHARAPVVASNKADEAPFDRLSRTDSASPGGPTARGAARFLDTILEGSSGDLERLPFPLNPERLSSAIEVRGRLLHEVSPGSRLSGFRDALEGAARGVSPVEAMVPPEGKRIFQLQTKTRKMQSLVGQALNFVGSTTNQYYVLDSSAERYMLAGYYAMVKRDGRDYFEFFYNPQPEETGSRGMVELSQETRKALRDQDDAILGLIFVVPPGKCLTSIQSQGGTIEFGRQFCVNNN